GNSGNNLLISIHNSLFLTPVPAEVFQPFFSHDCNHRLVIASKTYFESRTTKIFSFCNSRCFKSNNAFFKAMISILLLVLPYSPSVSLIIEPSYFIRYTHPALSFFFNCLPLFFPFFLKPLYV